MQEDDRVTCACFHICHLPAEDFHELFLRGHGQDATRRGGGDACSVVSDPEVLMASPSCAHDQPTGRKFCTECESALDLGPAGA